VHDPILAITAGKIRGVGCSWSSRQPWTTDTRDHDPARPTLLFGPGDPVLAHQTDERVDIVALERAAEFFARLPSAMSAR
jgi:acetylornithine deacetylase/succinyl-diaminopimelate desuccinylase-like protein